MYLYHESPMPTKCKEPAPSAVHTVEMMMPSNSRVPVDANPGVIPIRHDDACMLALKKDNACVVAVIKGVRLLRPVTPSRSPAMIRTMFMKVVKNRSFVAQPRGTVVS